MSYTQVVGNAGEQFAAQWLTRNGHIILNHGYRSIHGEIDLITKQDDLICFVEVKTRRPGKLDDALLAVNTKKQRRIILTALRYLQEENCELQPRFDVIAVELDLHGVPRLAEYLPGAFDGQNY